MNISTRSKTTTFITPSLLTNSTKDGIIGLIAEGACTTDNPQLSVDRERYQSEQQTNNSLHTSAFNLLQKLTL